MRIFDPGSTSTLAFIVLLLISSFDLIESRQQEHTVYWNSSNPLFTQVDPIYDSYTISLTYGETLKFVCPHGNREHLIVYMVDEMSFMNCLLSSTSKEQLRCNGKGKTERKLIRTHSPFPEATRFEAGISYYFISTSTGSQTGIESKHNGLCASHQMRLRLEIEEAPPPTTSLHQYQDHPRAKVFPHRTQESSETIDRSTETRLDERRASKDAPISDASSSITEEKMQQVIAWAQRGLEGTFRFQDQNQQAPVANVELNRLDTSAEAYYVVNEDAALYSSSSLRHLLNWTPILIVFLIFL